MLKTGSKRRRARKEIEEAKQAESDRERELAAKLEFIAAAEEKLANYERMKEQNEQAKGVFTQLAAEGVVDIDEHGTITPSKKKRNAEITGFSQE